MEVEHRNVTFRTDDLRRGRYNWASTFTFCCGATRCRRRGRGRGISLLCPLILVQRGTHRDALFGEHAERNGRPLPPATQPPPASPAAVSRSNES